MIEKQDLLSLYDKRINKIRDTYSENPNKVRAMILDEISEMPFFKKHTDLFGINTVPNGDAIIWAFHNQGAAKTVVLFNQYMDTSEKQSAEYLEDGWIAAKEWMMGLTIHLMELQKESIKSRGVNLLFLSIPVIIGCNQRHTEVMRSVVRFLADYKTQFDLNYEVVLSSEAQIWKTQTLFSISTGFAGRMLPVIMTKGMSAHVNTAYKGLNAISIANEVVKGIELNTEMSDTVNKRMTPPPAFIDFYSIKSPCDLSTPQYTIATFYWHYIKEDLNKKMCQLKELCAWSVEDAINQFNYSYNEYLRKQALPAYRECMHFDFEVVFVDACIQLDDPIEKMSLENRMIYWMNNLNSTQPVVLIGMMDLFYPAVSSAAYFEHGLSQKITEGLTSKAIDLELTSFHLSTSGIHFFKQSDTVYDKVLANMIMKNSALEDILRENGQLDLNVLHIGPRAMEDKEVFYHLDVVDTVPHVIDTLIAAII